MKKFLAYTSLFLMISGVLFAEDSDWQFNGQIQSRTEADGTDFNNETYMPIHTSLRTRINVSKEYSGALFFAQLSDSRLFGSSGTTMSSTSNLDIHQAYVKLSKVFDLPMNLQLGRFEMAYGTQRFLGAVGWHYIGRSYDGARFTFDFGDMLKLDVFSTIERGDVPYKGNSGATPAMIATDKGLHGLWAMFKLNDDHKADVFFYMESDPTRADRYDIFELSRSTFGFTHWGNYGDLSSIIEFGYQMGEFPKSAFPDSARSIAAMTVSVQAHYKMNDDTKLGIGFDMLSGQDPDKMTEDDDYTIYSPNFGTNHKFYGHMDYFTAFNGGINPQGLNDIYLMFNHKLMDKFHVGLNAHIFMRNQADDVTEYDSDGIPIGEIEDATMLGQEVDLMFKYKFNDKTTITWGNSFFLPGEIITAGLPDADISYWTYLMVTANF